MKTIFDYNQIITSTGQYEIEDIGNCCIRIYEESSLKEYWLLSISELGDTIIYQFGPTIIDSDDMLSKFDFHVEKFQYNEKRIINLLEKFFRSLYDISEVSEIDKDEFWSRLRGLLS